MKRRLAWLLALSLTLASVPVTGAAAAENTAVGTEVVTETVQEETGADAAEETTVADPTVEDEGETVVDVTAAGTENQEVTTENNEDATEAATTEVSGEGNTTGAVSTEVAAVVEPGTGEGLVVTDPVVEAETLAKGSWRQNQGKWYYVNEDGSNYTGWLFLNGRKYYLDENGVMQTGWIKVDDTYYYMDKDGIMQTMSWIEDAGKWYFVGEDGAMQKGWMNYGKGRFYFDTVTGAMKTGWIKDGENWYYADEDGYMQKGWVESYGKWFYMNEEGVMQTGWVDFPAYGKRCYFDENGVMYVGWLEDGGNWYYMDKNGYMQKGWVESYGKWFYMDEEGVMQTGWIDYGPNKFFFKEDGVMAVGWWQEGENWHYADKNGHVIKGWTQDMYSKKWYYFDDSYNMKTGWLQYKSDWYYLLPSGAMSTDAVSVGGEVWYFEGNGKLTKTEGWKINRTSNWMYYTYSNGRTARNETKDGKPLGAWGGFALKSIDLKAQNYGSRTDWLILVNKADFNVCVYWWAPKGGVWLPWKDWDCTHGGSLTPVGQWELEARVTKRDAYWGWAEFDYSSAAFAISISAGNFFHSILFDKLYEGNNFGSEYGGLNPYNRPIRDGAMRRDYSNSCIRLELPNAEWLYRNIPMGTKVVIY